MAKPRQRLRRCPGLSPLQRIKRFMAKQNLTLARARQAFRYDPDSGVLYRKHATREKVGKAKSNGYLVVCVDGENYQAHRVAWLLAYGKWPIGDIDHINRIKTDNRLANLRDVSKQMNSRNAERVTRTQIIGPMPQGDQWVAVVPHYKTTRTLGTFATHAEAYDAYADAAAVALKYEGQDEPQLRSVRLGLISR